MGTSGPLDREDAPGDTPRDALERALGAPPPPGLDVLDDGDRERLADLIETARRAQRQALVDAIDDGLRKLPRVVRGPVSKLIRG